jgi:hypothetical protein
LGAEMATSHQYLHSLPTQLMCVNLPMYLILYGALCHLDFQIPPQEIVEEQ